MDDSLLKSSALVNGQWVKGGDRSDVHDAATGLKIADVANLGAADAGLAIAAADAAWRAWRGETLKERSVVLRRSYDLLMANAGDLARLMTAEQRRAAC